MKNLKLLLIFVFTVFFSACQLLPENTQLRSYRVLVQQGNFIEESKVESLKINMSKEQVIFLLGEPVLDNIFDNNRWDYVYFRKRDPEETQLNMVSIFFEKDKIASMKRIVKNDDGLFEISGNTRRNKPEFIEDQEVLALQKNIFEDIELEASSSKTDKDVLANNSEEKIIESENNENKKQDYNDVLANNSEEKIIESENNDSNKQENYKTDNNSSVELVDKKINTQEKDNITEEESRSSEQKEVYKEVYSEPIKRKNDFEIVSDTLNQWISSWENKNLEKYFSYYIDGYTSKYFDSSIQWKKDRENRILDKNKISLEISNLSINFQIDEMETATAVFQQKYSSERYSDSVKKQIIFEKIDKNWKIISETLLEGEY